MYEHQQTFAGAYALYMFETPATDLDERSKLERGSETPLVLSVVAFWSFLVGKTVYHFR
jgi:hypothetical protein